MSSYSHSSTALKRHAPMKRFVNILQGILIPRSRNHSHCPELSLVMPMSLDLQFKRKGAAMVKWQDLVRPCACSLNQECLVDKRMTFADLSLTCAWTLGIDLKPGLSSDFSPHEVCLQWRTFFIVCSNPLSNVSSTAAHFTLYGADESPTCG